MIELEKQTRSAMDPKSLEKVDDKSVHTVRSTPVTSLEMVKPPVIRPLSEDQKLASAQNPIFDGLVKDDRDLIGLVSYSLYKISKREWITAFQSRQGRDPVHDEVQAYITGEQTARRLATYRRMAEDALAGRPPVRDPSEVGVNLIQPRPKMATNAAGSNLGMPLASNDTEAGVLPGGMAMSLTDGAKTVLKLPRETNMKLLLRYLVVLGILVGLLALSVNYAKFALFGK